MKDAPLSLALAGLAALAVAMGIGRFAFTPILPMMQADGSLDLARGGWLASANYAGYLAGGLSAMAWPWSARAAIRAGLLLVAVATLGMALPCGISGWLVLRAAAGVGSAWVLVFTSAAVLQGLDRAPAHDRAVLAGVLYAGVGVGVAIAGIVCAMALAAADPARASWIVTGAMASLATVLLWNRFGQAWPSRTKATPGAFLPPRALGLGVCYAAFGFGYIIPATFLSAMAHEAAHGGFLYAASWPLFGIAAAVSTTLVTRLAGRANPRNVWIAGHAVMAFGVAIAAMASGIAAVIACGLLVGGTFMVVTMAGMQEARREAGADASRMLAVMTSSFALGQIAGPLLVSALAATGSAYRVALGCAAALLIASAAVLHYLPRRASS
ncbi:MAG TPA: YbfB/YjiJ family MFS transporter [Usitatibacter sp.]|nr:YbfB/YjiJ family MFS transporter [Usitatibacter sp.]